MQKRIIMNEYWHMRGGENLSKNEKVIRLWEKFYNDREK